MTAELLHSLLAVALSWATWFAWADEGFGARTESAPLESLLII